jgi:uncharacterized membrane protein YdbT with pleckstrin-like domain
MITTTSNPTRVTIMPSQWVNTGWFLLAWASYWAGLWFEALWIIIPFALIFIGKYLSIYYWRYSFDEDTEALIERKGVFSVTEVEVQYFRIKSVRIQKPFFLRIFGLSTVEVITSEPYKPNLVLYGIKNGNEWAKFLLDAAKHWRYIKGVKETDFHNF